MSHKPKTMFCALTIQLQQPPKPIVRFCTGMQILIGILYCKNVKHNSFATNGYWTSTIWSGSQPTDQVPSNQSGNAARGAEPSMAVNCAHIY